MDEDVALLPEIAAMGPFAAVVCSVVGRPSEPQVQSVPVTTTPPASLIHFFLPLPLYNIGARFALSPIEPKGFIDACHKNGILAVPAGASQRPASISSLRRPILDLTRSHRHAGTSVNELWDMHRRGARVIKLFHAGIIGPKILK